MRRRRCEEASTRLYNEFRDGVASNGALYWTDDALTNRIGYEYFHGMEYKRKKNKTGYYISGHQTSINTKATYSELSAYKVC